MRALVALAATVLSASGFSGASTRAGDAGHGGLGVRFDNGERARPAPSFWLLPLIALWANLHGGFVFGLVLAGAFAIDALWKSRRSGNRWRYAGLRSGSAALAACCFTPYGWESILASRKILDLGVLLRLISEWAPAEFSTFSPFELTILALIAGVLYRGVKLSPPRIALMLGLLHMALSHGRNLEIFALLLPIVLLTPVSQHFALQPTPCGQDDVCFGGNAGRRCSASRPGLSLRTRYIRP